MDRPINDLDDSNQPTEKSINDVFSALSKLETVTEAMEIEELDGDLADLIRADHAQTNPSPLPDVNNNAIPTTISHLTLSEVQTTEQDQMRLFLKTPQFLPSFESFQRSVKQASVEGFAPKDLMNIPAISKTSDFHENEFDDSLILTPRTSQRLKEKDQLVNVNQRQFSGGSGQVKNHLTSLVEMSRPGTSWITLPPSQGHHSNKLQSRPDSSSQGNISASFVSSQSYKASFLPSTISETRTCIPGPYTSNQKKNSKYANYDHLSAKGKNFNEVNKISSQNIPSSSTIYHDSDRPSTPWIGSMAQNYQSKQEEPYQYENKTKMYRNYPNQPHKVSTHYASTSNIVNALRGNSTQTLRLQNSASVFNMKYPSSSNQGKPSIYKKPYSQAERIMDSSKEVELRKRLAAPNIYSTLGLNSSKMLYASSTKKPFNNITTVTSLNKSLPRGYTHMTASSKSSTEHKPMANYIDLTDGNAQNMYGYYKRRTEHDPIVKTEKQEMNLTPTIIPEPRNKQKVTESIFNNNRTQMNTYTDPRMGYDKSQKIKAEMINNNINSRCTPYPGYIEPNQDIGITGTEQKNIDAAVKNHIFGNAVKQRTNYNRMIRNLTDTNYSNYAYQNNNYDHGANVAANYNEIYQNCTGQSNTSGYVPNGNHWNYYYDESNTYDQSKSYPNYSSWSSNSGWYQQNNEFMCNTPSAFQQANQIVTNNNSLYPVHQENNLHMNIYNFNNSQGYPQQDARNGQPAPNYGTSSAIQNNVNGVESSMLILNRDILDLDEHQKQQRDLLIKIGRTRAIYNDKNCSEEEKHRRMSELLDSVLATPDGTNLVRYLLTICYP